MTTLDRLQTMLMKPAVEYRTGFFYKEILPQTVCADGTRLSIQASEFHYCSPRDNHGPYTEVEVWNINCDNEVEVLEFEYSGEEPAGYVDINCVVAYIDRHGGLAK